MTELGKSLIEQGLKQGLQRGKLSEKFEVAKAMLRKKYSLEEIKEITKLPEEEIKNLCSSII